ncbi:AVAST type 4 anti-phage nuclease Avs4 [Dehalococcoides mccartyi]|uniref:AVAST type 4 anti-phage nuclease Avs4 n=1 Tax=Dehalococcoides mccartyi TaxID=61435 RepID=UPI002FC65199
MQEINWNNFAAKYNGKEQSSFEWLCYILFCTEFNKPQGIFRYKNQAGIETEPIEHDGKVIGFQAKYFNTDIGSNKDEIKDAIEKAKRRNTKLNKILFYLNREFSESNKKGQKDPKYKAEIEKYASNLGVEIEWRCKSFFESPFVCDQNANIAKNFFSLEKSIIDFIGELIKHTESVLGPIHSNMQFKDTEIKIDRSSTLEELRAKFIKCPLVILSGEAGVGKTAIIKDYYDMVRETTPFFVFKAIEFNINNINRLFTDYGTFTFRDFIEEHQNHSEKIIVIDSAEKLSDIQDREVFSEFLSLLLGANWKVLITTRYGYIDALKFQLSEIHRIAFQSINIERLKPENLHGLAEKYNFKLPGNKRLLELLTTPFYLNEYLRTSNKLDETVSYHDFKDALWKKQIVKSEYQKNNAHIKREECFLKIALNRAMKGHLVVDTSECDEESLRSLDFDEIIKRDPVIGGYFITHDIYEEWALDRVIERTFRTTKDHQAFLQDIGTSLPIRRALRSWLSEKLHDNIDEVKGLIQNIVNDANVAGYWKDEICISVLLSDYAVVFFQTLKDKLLEDNAKLLMRLVFLTRIACKEIDEDVLALLGVKASDRDKLTITLTRPKGNGWNSIIQFIFDNKENIELHHANIIVPLLDDWTNKNKNGETTKKASLIALYYYAHYDEIVEISKSQYRTYSSRDEEKERLVKVILSGASEISDELKTILDEVISKRSTKFRDNYYDIVVAILGHITDGSEVIKVLPGYVIQLAELFWHQAPKTHYDYSLGVEPHFGISGHHDFHYFPSSAFQTPILQLLQVAPVETAKFILSFTNRATEYYRKSELGHEVSMVKVVFDDNQTREQYISNRLWNMYRGTHVSTDLLQSMHMALERWLVMNAKVATKETIESWCLYLLRETKSASITAIVISVCLAFPSKLFNVASILFKTKEFFLYDTGRMIRDQHAKGTYSIAYGMNYQNDLYVNERIKTCDDPHRRLTLEHLAFKYQLEQFEGESADVARKRQEVIWKILDKHYEALPEQSIETDADKTWRLFLARMDRRRMKAEVKESNEGVVVTFNPEIDPNLREFSEDSTGTAIAATKHTSIKLWADYRFRHDTRYQEYKAFEDSSDSVIAETREILENLEKGKDPFPEFNRTIPAHTCSVLIRDFSDKLSVKDKEFCRDIIIQFATIPLMIQHYQYQVDDGTEPSISTLPILMQQFPQDGDEIKTLLVLLLINLWREITASATRGILDWLWKTHFDDAHSIFLGYLLLKPKFNEFIRETMRKRMNNLTDIQDPQTIELFTEKHKVEFEKISANKITFNDLENLNNLDFSALEIAFELIPPNTQHVDHMSFLNVFLPLCAKELSKHDSKVNYHVKIRFMEKFACFILSSSKEQICTYLQPFIENFNDSRDMAQLLQEFISVEDVLNHYDEFWIVWNAFYDCIVKTYKKQVSNYYSNELIHNYLLAWPYWKKGIREWHTLKEREKEFYKKISEDIGHHPSVLYSISKVLNEIGSSFINDGVVWISNILQNNPQYTSTELETNTVYYIENITRRFILINRQRIKATLSLKSQVIVILDFLLEKGSTTGFLLRDDIL